MIFDYKKLLNIAQKKMREETVKEVIKQSTDIITITKLDDTKFSATEMAHIANSVKENVTKFLLEREEKLTANLEDVKQALENLKS